MDERLFEEMKNKLFNNLTTEVWEILCKYYNDLEEVICCMNRNDYKLNYTIEYNSDIKADRPIKITFFFVRNNGNIISLNKAKEIQQTLKNGEN